MQVKPPPEYKTGSKWKPFKEGAIAYFSSVKGAHNIPLAYVIRETEIPDPNAVYQTEYHQLVSITPLAGIEYEQDNGRIFDLLKSWNLNGPAWTWMRAFNHTRNGRASWQALVNHFEGEAQRDRVKDHAYAAIASAKYYGDRKKFTFETYMTINQDSYANLSQYGEIISKEKHVRDLLQGIKDNSAAANAAKGAILATPTLRNSFDNAVAHLATTLQLNMSMNDIRNISASGTQNNHGRGGGYQGGRQYNRGGRGGGQGRGRGRNLYLGSYSPEQWRKLSKEDKQKVYEGRTKSAEQRSQQGNYTQGGRTANPGRGVSSIVVQQQGDPDNHSQITGFITNTPSKANVSQIQASTVDNSILQGTLSGSAAVGDKRPNTDSAGSFMLQRRINTCVTTSRTRIISHVKKSFNFKSKVVHGNCKLDPHADTSIAGPNCVMLEFTEQVVNISAFSEKLEMMENIPIVTAATAIDNPKKTGETTILVIGQAIYMGDKVQNTLLCPNQMRVNGIHVDDIPMHLAPSSKPSTHSIHCPDDNFNIPLFLKGIFSYFPSRTPTKDELETCKHIYLTNDMYWDPHSEMFQEQENNINEHNTGDYYISAHQRQIMSVQRNDMHHISTAYDDSHTISQIASATSTNHQYKTTAERLSSLWNIGLETAKKTVQVTAQKGIRHTTLPIEQRFRTRQAQLRYKQLGGRHGRFYTDTFFSGVTPLNGNSMAQIFTSDLAFTKVYPMKLRSQTYEALSAFIHEVGIPSSIHSDDAKELMMGKFKELCKEFHIPCTYTEPYSPWQNRAENGTQATCETKNDCQQSPS
jgi:hypothetical protein